MSQMTHSGGEHGSSDANHGSHGSMKSYIVGFALSLLLTIIPLVVVLNGLLTGTAATVVLLVTAVLQFVVQLLFFMHLREEDKPRYNLMTLLFGLVVLLTIVGGSIWIMTYNQVSH
jgi:cytochrome o ubiquinol oxidase operon protein cyoD